MLWADKYRPKELSALDYHKEQALDLKNLTEDGDFPHLLVHGPFGAGKKTRIMCLLREIYGPGVERLKIETMNFTTPCNKKLEINMISSNYHIEVDLSKLGIHDRVVIKKVIKNMAQTHQLDADDQQEFKVIVLTDVAKLTKDAQHALRRIMEKYIANCRIILCTTSISWVIPAIRSRCLCIRVPAPTNDQIVSILTNVCSKESLILPAELLDQIVEKCNRNLRQALLMAEACKVEQQNLLDPNYTIPEPEWQVFIRNIAKKIVHGKSIAALANVRDYLHKLIIFEIPSDIMFTTLLNELLENCPMDLIGQVVHQAALYDHRMVQGNKEIFHLEAFVAKCMCLFQNMGQELMDCDF